MRRLMTIAIACMSVMLSHAQHEVHIARYYGDCEAALSFTFDDGLREHYSEVFPRLKRFGLKASFGIIGSKVGRDHKGIPCMTWEQLREMAADGQEITSHGFRHQSLEQLTGEAQRYEVQHNDTVIYNNVGIFPRTYFYPGNRKTSEAITFCSHNRVGTRLFQSSFGSKRDSLWMQRTLAYTLKKGEWTVLMTHGISVGYDAFPNPQLLWNTLEQVAAMQDRLWVATLHDVLAYMAERNSLRLDVEQQNHMVTVTPRSPLDKALFFHPVTVVISGEAVEAKQGKRTLTLIKKGSNTLFDIDPNGDKIQIKMKQ